MSKQKNLTSTIFLAGLLAVGLMFSGCSTSSDDDSPSGGGGSSNELLKAEDQTVDAQDPGEAMPAVAETHLLQGLTVGALTITLTGDEIDKDDFTVKYGATELENCADNTPGTGEKTNLTCTATVAAETTGVITVEATVGDSAYTLTATQGAGSTMQNPAWHRLSGTPLREDAVELAGLVDGESAHGDIDWCGPRRGRWHWH